jgi:hypothetical protein
VLQFARGAVHSYPYFPDPLSCCSLLGGVRLLALPEQQHVLQERG